jgi:hypothetical protein
VGRAVEHVGGGANRIDADADSGVGGLPNLAKYSPVSVLADQQ